LKAELEKHKPLTPKERVINRATEVLKEIIPDVTDEQLKNLTNRLNNDQRFAVALKSVKAD
jgi:hypothetical protein